MSDKRYMVYRVYTKKERSDPNERVVLYGWTSDKNVLKAFLAQRDEKKYTYMRIDQEDIGKYFDENVDDTDIQIDIIWVKSAGSREDVPLFTTMDELNNAEKDIQKYFRNLASFEDIEGDGDYVQMVIHLDEYFASALFYLGYRPQDIDYMYPSASDEDSFSGLSTAEREIDWAYDGMMQSPQEEYHPLKKPLGLYTLSDVSSKILYSLENIIKAMRDNL